MSARQAEVSEYLNAQQVAARIQVCVETLYNWRTRRPRRGPRGTRIGRQLLYKAADVDAWLAEREAEELARETGQA